MNNPIEVVAHHFILGGVVLFDRRNLGSSSEVDVSTNVRNTSSNPLIFQLDAIYFHSDQYEVTYQIYKLPGDQIQQLIAFLLSDESPKRSCPISILGNSDNYPRGP